MIDLYCERTAPGPWAEPLNAISNVAFLLAALAAWLTIRRLGRARVDLAFTVGLTVLVGVGSALFHTLATPWARILDVVPILLFQLGFLWLYARNIVGLPGHYAAALLAVFLAAALGGRQFPATLNGSLTYAPAVLVLVGLGAHHYVQARCERWTLLVASVLFVLSVMFRGVDLEVCAFFPIGTHFLWHLLNGVVLYLAVRCLALGNGKVVATA